MEKELNIINEKESLSNNLKRLIEYSLNEQNDSKNNIINNNENEVNSKNILEKFIDDSNIINNKNDLISFINEMIYQLNKGNNIIIPFLEICPILIKSYIEINLDVENNNKFLELFKLLKINSFISREYLYPIYEYFSDLLYLIKDIEENDEKLKKINRVFELWKIFYDFEIDKNNLKYFNSSSFCSIGGSLKVSLYNEIKLNNDIPFTIKIYLLDKISSKLNEKLILFRTENNNDIKFSIIEEELMKNKNENENIICLIFKPNKVIITIKTNEKSEEYFKVELDTGLSSLKDFYLLDNFYGKIKSLELCINFNNILLKLIKFGGIFEPYPMTDDGCLYNCSKNEINKNFISIYSINKDLFKVNYINYLENNFDIIDYLRGFTPFIPFIQLINGINLNKNINVINGNDKKIFLHNFIYEILFLLCKMAIKYKNKYISDSHKQKKILYKIKKYNLFAFSLILQIDSNLLENIQNKTGLSKSDEIFEIIGNLDDNHRTNSLIYRTIINKSKTRFDNFLKSEYQKIIEVLFSMYGNGKRSPLNIKSTNSQLYRNIMKELFIYNRYWSKKEFFFEDKKQIDNNYKLKYKQLSYYTKNYQQPLLYPILNFNEYLPSFSSFDINNLFKHELNKIINYDFSFIDNSLTQLMKENDPLTIETKRVNCCLVKKHYHVKGEIIIIERGKNANNHFEIIFCSNSDDNGNTCNKIMETLYFHKFHYNMQLFLL